MRFLLCLLLISTFGSQPAFADSMTECESVIREGNEPMAYKRCLSAAKGGNPKAQVLVGMALMAGVGVLKDPDAAVNWFRRAADQKYPGGMYNLALATMAGLGTAQDESTGMALMRKAAHAGEPRAADFLEKVGSPMPQQKTPPKIMSKRRRTDCSGMGCGTPFDGQPR